MLWVAWLCAELVICTRKVSPEVLKLFRTSTHLTVQSVGIYPSCVLSHNGVLGVSASKKEINFYMRFGGF